MSHEDRIVGATIAGKYRVRRVIGAGSMGVVCEAEHVDIGKRVAIKLIDASLAGMDDIAQRFRQEARAASLIESHHIVQVFDVGADEGLGLYLVMEYLIGEDLSRTLARERRLPVESAVRIAVQIGRGLAKAHEAGVVHRDLKPANIFLCSGDDGQPLAKILDFGISKLVASSRGGFSPGLKLTRDGMVVGTPQYMSPEQAQGYTVDDRTDVWALGLVLYEMLAGRPAYPELPSYERFIIHLVSEPPEPLIQVAPWVSEELAGIVHGALAHDLAKRIPSCAEFVRRLVELHAAPSRASSGRPAPGSVHAIADGSDTLVMTGSHGRSGLGRGGREIAVEGSAAAPASGGPDESGAVAPEPRKSPRLTASGVRGAAHAAPRAPDDFEQDAPQFFDRKLLEPFAAPGVASGRSIAGGVVPPAPVRTASARPATSGSSASQPESIAVARPPVPHAGPPTAVSASLAAARPPPGRARLSAWIWAGLAALVVGVLAAAVLASR
jgi:serine/threonine protein kinase